MVLKCLLFILFLCSFPALAKVSDECESALKTLFAENVSKDQASNFLKVQGDLTLHRMAWAYLKAQKGDQGNKLENVERTILTLLDEKYPAMVVATGSPESAPVSGVYEPISK